MKSTILLIFFYSIVSFALPNKPANPESTEAYELITNYYEVKNSLPDYSVKEITEQIRDNFIYRDVTLSMNSSLLKNRNDFHFTLKIPLHSTKQVLPVIALFTGFQTGTEAINLIKEQGENIILGFQYPMPIYHENCKWGWDWSAFESIPLLMTATVDWLHQQSYVDTTRINLLSVSFGTVFTPLALRMMQQLNIQVKTTTLGYGGGDIPVIVGNELRKSLGNNETGLLKILVDHQTWIYEPKYHVDKLEGNFLIVHGQEDNVFPPESIVIFDEKLTGNKNIVTLPGPHIQPDRQDLIDNFNDTVFSYLKEQDAINAN